MKGLPSAAFDDFCSLHLRHELVILKRRRAARVFAVAIRCSCLLSRMRDLCALHALLAGEVPIGELVWSMFRGSHRE